MVLLILLLSLSENVCSIFRKAFYQRHRDFELNVVSFTVSAMLIGYWWGKILIVQNAGISVAVERICRAPQ